MTKKSKLQQSVESLTPAQIVDAIIRHDPRLNGGGAAAKPKPRNRTEERLEEAARLDAEYRRRQDERRAWVWRHFLTYHRHELDALLDNYSTPVRDAPMFGAGPGLFHVSFVDNDVKAK